MSIEAPIKTISNGLVLHLDAANNKSYPGSGTTWFDLSGNSNNGTLTNGPTFSNSNAGRIVFDGSNDYISTNYSASIASSGFTFNCFFFNTYFPADIKFLASMHVNSDFNTLFRIELNNRAVGSLEFGHCYNGTSIQDGDELVSNNFPNNTWHFVSLLWDGTTKYIYKNGIFEASANVSARPIQNYSGATLRVAARHDGDFRPMSGYISTVSLYNRALSPAEILQNYDSTKSRFGL